ncbi:MAG: hypothetical protein M5R36_10765 [Deltaproteobacteria bacterium]|nr:hypothetical protein [Deltaproteobacteria bacterium]
MAELESVAVAPAIDMNVNELIAAFIQRLGVARQSFRLFSAENATAKENLARFRETLEACFEIHNPVSLVIVQERLYFDELPVRSRHPLVADLVDVLLERLIRRVVFYKKVSDREINAFIQVTNLDPIQLRDSGGPQTVLIEDHNVQHIEVGELTGFATAQSFDADSWQSAVQKTGIDVEEVVAFMKGPRPTRYKLVDDKFSDIELRSKALLRQEAAQLVELLLSPRVLAKLLLELAQIDTPEGPMVDPRELMRIVRRSESAMLFHSPHPDDLIRERLTDALRLLGPEVRVAVLAEYLRMRSEGVHAANADLFKFSADEWARAVVELGAEPDGDRDLARVAFTDSPGNASSRLSAISSAGAPGRGGRCPTTPGFAA